MKLSVQQERNKQAATGIYLAAPNDASSANIGGLRAVFILSHSGSELPWKTLITWRSSLYNSTWRSR